MDQDTEVLDQELESQQQDEPRTTLPEHAGGEKEQDRQALVEEAMDEGVQEAEVQAVIDELGDTQKHPELTLDDLKSIPGAEGMSDEELKAEWARAVKAAQGDAAQAGQAGIEQTVKLPFPVYDKQGNKVDPDKVNLEALLSGDLQIGYNALGKEQRKALTDVIRNASMGHWNEQRYTTTLQERDRVAGQMADLQKQVDQFTNERKVWDAALTALSMGNIEPMKKLAEAYKQAISAMPQAAPGMVSAEQVRVEQEQAARGQQFINEVLVPAGMDIAKRYGADPKEVLGAIEFFIRRDLNFLTQEKIDQIIQFEVPQLLEQHGYSAALDANDPSGLVAQPTDKVAELEKTVKALQERIAGQANEAVDKTRRRQKTIPPVGSGATPGAGDSMPSFSSRSQMKAWMQGDANWQKA